MKDPFGYGLVKFYLLGRVLGYRSLIYSQNSTNRTWYEKLIHQQRLECLQIGKP